MRTEDQCEPSQRYLFSDAYFSDQAIDFCRQECEKRNKDPEKGEAHRRFINWRPNPHEIAVFTLYAYADLEIPKKFDIIFQVDDPAVFVQTTYELVQSIYEGWLPSNRVEHGHKHLSIFRFDNGLPEILHILHKEEGRTSSAPKGQKLLGFCHSKDFDQIKRRIEKTLELKALHGEKWWGYDDGK